MAKNGETKPFSKAKKRKGEKAVELLPLTSVIFSLLAGAPDMGGPTSDTKRDILVRYIGKHVVEDLEEESFQETFDESEEEIS